MRTEYGHQIDGEGGWGLLDLGLRGKVAAVGGASAGLGYATAEELAREGAAVVIASRSAERIASAAERLRHAVPGADVLAVVADLSTPEGCAALIEGATAGYGGLDCLLLNGGGPKHGYALDADDAAWHTALDAVLLAVVRQMRLALPAMLARGGGRVLAVTSTSVRQPIPDLVLSNSLRAAVVGFLKSLANEYAARNVLINCLAPGRFGTERVLSADAARAERQGLSPEAEARRSMAQIPIGRYGEAPEYACAATFLLSFANTYMTGTHVYCDGGQLRTVL